MSVAKVTVVMRALTVELPQTSGHQPCVHAKLQRPRSFTGLSTKNPLPLTLGGVSIRTPVDVHRQMCQEQKPK